jgi:hypothetical protein
MNPKKDYLTQYNAKRVPTFAMGGAAPMGAAPMGDPMGGDPGMAAPQGDDPLMLAQQAVETQDGALALEVCALLLQAAGGGMPPAPADPMGGAPMGDPGMGAPMAANGMALPRYRQGGAMPKLKRNIAK